MGMFYVCTHLCVLYTGMVKIVVDQFHNVAMFRSSTLDCYLTGHVDTAVVNGRVCSYTNTYTHTHTHTHTHNEIQTHIAEYMFVCHCGHVP